MAIEPRYFRKKLRRAKTGLASQDVVAMYAISIAEDVGLDLKVVSTASYGQKDSDVVVRVNGTEFGIEVKGIKDHAKLIPIFDKSVRRHSVPKDIENITEAYISTLSLGGASVRRLMSIEGYPSDFLGLLDFFRDHVDGTVGLAEDSNSSSSGKLPKEFLTTDPYVLKAARAIILGNLKVSRDSYFAIHDKSRDSVNFYYTGFGTNVLLQPRFPNLRQAALDTYGGASAGATRVAFKVRI